MIFINTFCSLTGWVDGSQLSELLFYQLDRDAGPVKVTFYLKVKEDFSWTLHICGKLVNREGCAKIKEIPCISNSGMCLFMCVTCMYIQTLLISLQLVAVFSKLIASISTSHACEGNSDENFIGLPNIHRGVMKDVSS